MTSDLRKNEVGRNGNGDKVNMEHDSWLVPCHSEAGEKKGRQVTKKEA